MCPTSSTDGYHLSICYPVIRTLKSLEFLAFHFTHLENFQPWVNIILCFFCVYCRVYRRKWHSCVGWQNANFSLSLPLSLCLNYIVTLHMYIQSQYNLLFQLGHWWEWIDMMNNYIRTIVINQDSFVHTGSNGQPIYKQFYITGGKGRKVEPRIIPNLPGPCWTHLSFAGTFYLFHRENLR